jgi:hypothetical protein
MRLTPETKGSRTNVHPALPVLQPLAKKHAEANTPKTSVCRDWIVADPPLKLTR